MIMKSNRVVVPSTMRQEMLGRIHSGHLGMEKQKRLASGSAYWPGINKDIERGVQGCSTCQRFRPAQKRDYGNG